MLKDEPLSSDYNTALCTTIDRSHSPRSSIHQPHGVTHSLHTLADRMMKIHAKWTQRLFSGARRHTVTLHDWLHLCMWQDRCNYSRVSVSCDSASGLNNSLGLEGSLRSVASQAMRHTRSPDSDCYEVMTQGNFTQKHTATLFPCSKILPSVLDHHTSLKWQIHHCSSMPWRQQSQEVKSQDLWYFNQGINKLLLHFLLTSVNDHDCATYTAHMYIYMCVHIMHIILKPNIAYKDNQMTFD